MLSRDEVAGKHVHCEEDMPTRPAAWAVKAWHSANAREWPKNLWTFVSFDWLRLQGGCLLRLVIASGAFTVSSRVLPELFRFLLLRPETLVSSNRPLSLDKRQRLALILR